jgi:hypothetical protein
MHGRRRAFQTFSQRKYPQASSLVSAIPSPRCPESGRMECPGHGCTSLDALAEHTAMIHTGVPLSTRCRLMRPASAERRLTTMLAPKPFVGTPVLSTTWKSTDGPRIHRKYIVDNAIVYRGCDARVGVQHSAACRVTWFSSRQQSSCLMFVLELLP